MNRTITTACAVSLAIAALSMSACGGKKYLPSPEERPGEVEQINPAIRETDQRARQSVDVPVQ